MSEWPPLIRADRVPAWVRVRDLALTIAAWVVLLYWIRGALLLIWDWFSYPLFELSTEASPDWERIWATLAPFIAVAALLSAWLFYWALRRRTILMRQRAMLQPATLDPGVHANQYGLSVEDVANLRGAQVVTVHFDANGAVICPARAAAAT